MRSCHHDPAHRLPDDSDPRRIYCSTTCRTAAHRARHRTAEADFRAEAATLLIQQTAAIQSGDTAALAEVERRSALLFRR